MWFSLLPQNLDFVTDRKASPSLWHSRCCSTCGSRFSSWFSWRWQMRTCVWFYHLYLIRFLALCNLTLITNSQAEKVSVTSYSASARHVAAFRLSERNTLQHKTIAQWRRSHHTAQLCMLCFSLRTAAVRGGPVSVDHNQWMHEPRRKLEHTGFSILCCLFSSLARL